MHFIGFAFRGLRPALRNDKNDDLLEIIYLFFDEDSR